MEPDGGGVARHTRRRRVALLVAVVVVVLAAAGLVVRRALAHDGYDSRTGFSAALGAVLHGDRPDGPFLRRAHLTPAALASIRAYEAAVGAPPDAPYAALDGITPGTGVFLVQGAGCRFFLALEERSFGWTTFSVAPAARVDPTSPDRPATTSAQDRGATGTADVGADCELEWDATAPPVLHH